MRRCRARTAPPGRYAPSPTAHRPSAGWWPGARRLSPEAASAWFPFTRSYGVPSFRKAPGRGCWSGLPLHAGARRVALLCGLGILLAALAMDGCLDLVAEVLVHVAPVLEGTLKHRPGHPVEQVPGDVADQPFAGRV